LEHRINNKAINNYCPSERFRLGGKESDRGGSKSQRDFARRARNQRKDFAGSSF